MTIERTDISAPPGPIMSKCVVHDGRIYLSGMIADDVSTSIEQQTRDVLAAIDRYLAQAGSDKSKLLTAQIWLPDMRLFQQMNSVWNAWVDPKNPPARACVGAVLPRPGALVEIMVTAAR